ncbi:hypothetical protein [Microbacterium elymi]|uniref:Transcriptional regulator n=1 Tax=Microbacterium elymi TaxID=2909587 RepID=A0ABY5NKP1_9MICO|nr:hypothetical protein [Microbacterium elymi]UUT35701.1 hypothetical protein L2X98_20935 [Microbacterium elymi]
MVADRDGEDARSTVVEVMREQGFAPNDTGDVVLLERCPLIEAASRHPAIVCAVHQGMIDGILGARGSDAESRLIPFTGPGECTLRCRPRRERRPRQTPSDLASGLDPAGGAGTAGRARRGAPADRRARPGHLRTPARGARSAHGARLRRHSHRAGTRHGAAPLVRLPRPGAARARRHPAAGRPRAADGGQGRARGRHRRVRAGLRAAVAPPVRRAAAGAACWAPRSDARGRSSGSASPRSTARCRG